MIRPSNANQPSIAALFDPESNAATAQVIDVLYSNPKIIANEISSSINDPEEMLIEDYLCNSVVMNDR